MFYSQIILAKKGPLAKVWLAAHNWNDKKLGGRPQIFATDIAASVDSIVHPTVPLALRVSGHLLWGVVRIYSKKVHYLLNDCHQAVLKLKVAFRNHNQPDQMLVIDMDERRRKRKSTQTAEDVVPHFGEFNEGDDAPGMAGAFQVPLVWNEQGVDQDDWVAADLDDEEEEEEDDENRQPGDHLEHDMGAFSGSSPGLRRSMGAMDGDHSFGHRAEEEWTAFDPDDEEDEEKDAEAKKGDKKDDDTTVSDIEVTRAVNESVNSDAIQSARPSVLDQTGDLLMSPKPPMDDDDGFMAPDSPTMPMYDDDAPQTVPMSEEGHNASTGFSFSKDDSMTEKRKFSIGGLDDDSSTSSKRKAEEEATDKPKAKRARKPKRKRNIVLNEQLELTGAQIRAQLDNTDDIVRQDVLHPATWVPDKDAAKRRHPNTEKLYTTLTCERLLCRPSLGDDGHLAPELLELWRRHNAVVMGEEFPYKLRSPKEQAVEETRRGQVDDDSDSQGSDPHDRGQKDDDNFPMPDDDGQPMFDDDAAPAYPDDSNMEYPPEDEEEEAQGMEGLVDSPDSRNASLSFSLVNDLLGPVDDDNPRQTLGSDELTSSKSKWHKHTTQVFSLLKSRMSSGKSEAHDDDEEETPKPSQLSYTALSHGCTRRAAATVFLELLQLKTWDFVELEQDASFGDITILPGSKFDEDIPTKD